MSLPVVLTNGGIILRRNAYRGPLAIAGTTKVGGENSPCRVYLHTVADGLNIGYRRSAVDGTYTFADLEAGAYYLVILDDRQDIKRAKVEHVVLS